MRPLLFALAVVLVSTSPAAASPITATYTGNLTYVFPTDATSATLGDAFTFTFHTDSDQTNLSPLYGANPDLFGAYGASYELVIGDSYTRTGGAFFGVNMDFGPNGPEKVPGWYSLYITNGFDTLWVYGTGADPLSSAIPLVPAFNTLTFRQGTPYPEAFTVRGEMTPVPEPATLTLLTAGLTGLAYRGRRRR
jgi:hypothetical protein